MYGSVILLLSISAVQTENQRTSHMLIHRE